MLNIKIEGNTYPIKQSAEEFTIGEYENVAAILNNDDINEVERFSQAFVMLGMNEDLLDSFDAFAFFKLIGKFKDYQMEVGEFSQIIEVNGRTYESFKDGNEFYFSVKDMRLIEEYVKKNPTFFIAEIIAILFKDVELTKTEHYDDAHIKHKAKLFRKEITYDIALPFIADFSQNLIESLESFKN